MAPPPPVIDVNLSLGPLLIGCYFNTILYGVTVVQTLLYYKLYKKDPSWIRYFILYLFVCETGNTICLMAATYEPLIQRFGTEYAVANYPMMIAAVPLLTVLISTPIQFFIAWRIKIISRSSFISIPICVLSLGSFAGGVWTTISIIIGKTFSATDGNKPSGGLWLTCSTLADIFITVSLMYNLHRRRTGIARTDDLLTRITRMTVQTGLITTVWTVLDLALLLTTSNAVFLMFDLCLAELYLNALLSTLNARAGWRKQFDDDLVPNVLFTGGSIGPSPSTAPITGSIPSTRNTIQTEPSTPDDSDIFELNRRLPAYAKDMESLSGIKVTKEILRSNF
ncbi:hypothetical protein HGRIS_013809 [Hohenbuehelia grisea]|uniref:DUF6534 domain-containing protein n=1 Tax=Hohenbuehelia grisea TaxID=104357 RepID=A0ABR3IWV8_9AGAR